MVPLGQLFDFVVPPPRKPNSIAIFECPKPPKTWSASVWFTPRVPFFRKCACWYSAFAIPPSAVPKLTPTRSCGVSGEYGNRASSSAIFAEAPKIRAPSPDAGDGSDSGDDSAALRHFGFWAGGFGLLEKLRMIRSRETLS